MSEIAKGLLGVWSLLAGWIFPSFIFTEMAAITASIVLDEEPFRSFFSKPLVDTQITILFLATVVGFLLSALQTPLYKILEGYWLWPPPLQRLRIERHRKRRDKIIAQAREAAKKRTGESNIWAGMRYSSQDKELAPTTLGNAMRRFETYASDRYRLDSQTLYHHLGASTPEYVMKAQDAARVSVDFGVCAAWAGLLLSATSLAAWFSFGDQHELLIFLALGSLLAAFAGYRIAITGTDEWAATIRAQVDLGRAKLAESLGLKIPEDLTAEREMWSLVNTFVKAPYGHPETDRPVGLGSLAAARLDKYRIKETPSEAVPQTTETPGWKFWRSVAQSIRAGNGKGQRNAPRP